MNMFDFSNGIDGDLRNMHLIRIRKTLWWMHLCQRKSVQVFVTVMTSTAIIGRSM